MAYRFNFSDNATAELDQLFQTIRADSVEAAFRWFNSLQAHIETLAAFPRGGSPTHQDPSVRQIIYGRKPHFYRVLYEVHDDTEQVVILSIWHGRRQSPNFLSNCSRKPRRTICARTPSPPISPPPAENPPAPPP